MQIIVKQWLVLFLTTIAAMLQQSFKMIISYVTLDNLLYNLSCNKIAFQYVKHWQSDFAQSNKFKTGMSCVVYAKW
jgi:hypothetical protein